MSINSPYNFVPLSAWVYQPDWAEQVSHDIPFSDGISGTFEIEIEAETPILIGGEQTEGTEHSPGTVVPYKTPDGKHAIPGASLKGAIKNVLTIASFGKLSQVDDPFLSFRDLHNATYRTRLTETLKHGHYKAISQAGWLTFENTKWIITACEYARVEQADLINYYVESKGPYRNYNEKNKQESHAKKIHNKQSSLEKYEVWNIKRSISFDYDKNKDHKHSRNTTLRYSKARNLGIGKTEGTLVLTGQPQAYRPGERGKKHMEFIFYNTKEKYEISEKTIESFFNVHAGKDSAEWQHWYNRAKGGKRVPVFFLANAKEITSLGFSMMYRLPYSATPHRLIKNTSPDHLSDKVFDLAEVIFGTPSDTERELSLKGRVSFGLAKSENTQTEQSNATILSSPKISYYPNYIEQDQNEGRLIKNKYETYEYTTKTKIRGWKRYPIHNSGQIEDAKTDISNKVKVVLNPVKAGAIFKGKVRVHNLKKVELGALAWALQWGNNRLLRHNIGMAKPYGLGRIRISIKEDSWSNLQANNTSLILPSIEEAIHLYEEHMNEAWKAPQKNSVKSSDTTLHWLNSEQLTQLKAMATNPIQLQSPLILKYPNLEPENEFSKAKGDRKCLKPYICYKGKKDSELFNQESIQDSLRHKKRQKLKKENRISLQKQRAEKAQIEEKKSQTIIKLKKGHGELGSETIDKLVEKQITQDKVLDEMESLSKQQAKELSLALQAYWGHIKQKKSNRHKNRLKRMKQILES